MFVLGCEIVWVFKDSIFEVDVLLMDYLLGLIEIDGLNLICLICVCYLELKILVVLVYYNKVMVGMVMYVGVCGFVGKEEELLELVCVICIVVMGGKCLNVVLVVEMESDVFFIDVFLFIVNGSKFFVLFDCFELSLCECEVLCCCFDGMLVMDIVEKFVCSIKIISL